MFTNNITYIIVKVIQGAVEVKVLLRVIDRWRLLPNNRNVLM